MKMKQIKLGVTGSIGSGKSLFCDYLSQKDFPVIKADDISKDLLITDETIKNKVKKIFGESAYVNNEINKKFLAEKIFSDPKNVFEINSIVHPKVIEKINELFENQFKSEKLIIVEAALIYEADMENMFDYVVLITADEKTRLERKTKNNKMSKEDFFKRNENQIKDEEKKKRADFIFENNGTKESLIEKAELLFQILVQDKLQ